MLKNNTVVQYVIFLSVFILSYLWQCHLYAGINDDGVTYLQGASAFLQGGFRAAVAVGYQAEWPFYSILIAVISQLIHVNLFIAASVTNVFFIGLSGILFLLILRKLSLQPGLMYWGALVWLGWHTYSKWWPQIIRDHGALCFLLLSFWCFLQFYQKSRWGWAWLWSLSLFCAVLFRIETIVFLLLVPWLDILKSKASLSQRCIAWFKLNSLLIVVALFATALLFLYPVSMQHLRIEYFYDSLLHYFSIAHEIYLQKRADLAVTFSDQWQRYVGLLLVLKLVYGAAVCLIKLLTPVGCIALIFARWVARRAPIRSRNELFSYLLISALIPTLFYYQHLFMNGRYLLPLGVFALLLLMPTIVALLENLSFRQWRLLPWLMMLALVGNFVATLFRFGHISTEQERAGIWIKQNLPGKRVFSNSKIMLYYSGTLVPSIGSHLEIIPKGNEGGYLATHGDWCQYDVLALRGDEQLTLLYRDLHERQLTQGEAHIFHAEHGSDVAIVATVNKQDCYAQ